MSPSFGAIVVIMIALHPLVDAICTLTFVTPYKRQLTENRVITWMRNFGKNVKAMRWSVEPSLSVAMQNSPQIAAANRGRLASIR